MSAQNKYLYSFTQINYQFCRNLTSKITEVWHFKYFEVSCLQNRAPLLCLFFARTDCARNDLPYEIIRRARASHSISLMCLFVFFVHRSTVILLLFEVKSRYWWWKYSDAWRLPFKHQQQLETSFFKLLPLIFLVCSHRNPHCDFQPIHLPASPISPAYVRILRSNESQDPPV